MSNGTPASADVRIRMYRPGLGDCWLLTFANNGEERHVLLDCGVFIGTPDQKQRLTRIAAHVRATTGDKVDALVATHEHWDHVAGFFFAKEEFEKLDAKEVWVAWTEDPDQTIAKEIRKEKKAVAKAVGLAVNRMMSSDSAYDRECGAAAARVMDFSGSSPAGVLGAAEFSVRSDEAMRFVVDKRHPGDKFLKPGDVLYHDDWVPGGLRIYVLSPPVDRDQLRQDRTPIGEGFKTEIPKKAKDGAASGWKTAVLGALGQAASDEESLLAQRLRPFDVSLAWPEDEIFHQTSSDIRLDQPMMKLGQKYRECEWRRIDNDWLQSAAPLALQLDQSINNTSLVLAFELVKSGKVLLFVGDSELESWKSWQNLVFTLKDKSTVTAQDLLARTVFYKVGHHGSGNATLRAGLTAMTSPELVAAVPTDTDFAKEKQGWEMPATKLVPALAERTGGRVLYADPGKECIREQNPGALSKASWENFVNSVDATNELFVDYRILLTEATER